MKKFFVVFFLMFINICMAIESPFREIHFKEMITQNFARDFAQEFLDETGKWVVITADKQTKLSPDGNLYATFVTLVPRDIEPLDFSSIILKTLKDLGIEAKSQYNQIFLNNKRVALYTCGFIPHYTENLVYVLITLALNVNTPSEELPYFETSLSNETQENFDQNLILNKIGQHLAGCPNYKSYSNDFFQKTVK